TAVQEIRLSLKLDTPVIAMTAHAMPGEREKCLSYGMNEYISKPIKEEQLLNLITKFSGSRIATTAELQNSTGINNNNFHYINLEYMKEISQGDSEYEKTVTSQFLEMVTEHLRDIEKYWQQRNTSALRQTAHNMKTSVSIMGLTEQLLPYLDALEHESLTGTSFQQYFHSLNEICTKASEEAKTFYQSL
ncbi:MAG: response regulator, partial [Bacteroidetes bacterium]|nr:response regulator [Bacteroidota bacterium]